MHHQVVCLVCNCNILCFQKIVHAITTVIATLLSLTWHVTLTVSQEYRVSLSSCSGAKIKCLPWTVVGMTLLEQYSLPSHRKLAVVDGGSDFKAYFQIATCRWARVTFSC